MTKSRQEALEAVVLAAKEYLTAQENFHYRKNGITVGETYAKQVRLGEALARLEEAK